MGEIKFRAWHKILRNYAHIKRIWLDDDGDGHDEIFAVSDVETTYPIHEVILEQYAGLKDKNGKEIYEGDIVRTKSPDRANFNAGAIEMVQQMYLVMNSAHYRDPEISHCEPLGYYCDTELEVIGNIHENPELLSELP